MSRRSCDLPERPVTPERTMQGGKTNGGRVRRAGWTMRETVPDSPADMLEASAVWFVVRLGALDFRRVAARRRVVDVQVGGTRIGEQTLDRRFEIATGLHQLPAEHHRIGVEGTNGERAQP